jgi:hypothetical protein
MLTDERYAAAAPTYARSAATSAQRASRRWRPRYRGRSPLPALGGGLPAASSSSVAPQRSAALSPIRAGRRRRPRDRARKPSPRARQQPGGALVLATDLSLALSLVINGRSSLWLFFPIYKVWSWW